ncbi:hypothetical protein [Clostridium sp. HBUAS56017]|uniref:hypothetical protein n=1 Tax=Clostridium sp. HBUAS56017 TaxID=2571128 RepID=UPI001177A08E|nr:hypothetical protein [Clostridium sp. HBUAS56017]
MKNIFNDHIKHYKNFNMGAEIDIAGTFIYNGIKELDSIESFHYGSEVFTFLYPISVGIERLQKSLIVLVENISEDEIEDFERSLITHSHQGLHDRIKKHIDIKFNSRQNGFLQILNNFYKNCRYERFNIKGQYDSEKVILIDYIKANLSDDKIERDIFGNEINTTKTKELLGRVIGSIARTYYENIYEFASRENLYTYELRSGSKASKIFLSQVSKNSLQEQIINEQISLKEFLVFLINTKSKNSFYKFIKEIQPLNLDIALANSYLESICKGNIPSDLVDEVEFWYEECSYSKDRVEMIDCIGNTMMDFEFGVILKLKEELEKVISRESTCDNFANEFSERIEEIDDEEVLRILNDILIICNEYKQDNNDSTTREEGFFTNIESLYEELISYIGGRADIE